MTTSQRRVWPLYCLALSLLLSPVAFAEEPSPGTSPSGKTDSLEPVEVDTSVPVLPKVLAQPLDTRNMTLGQAKEALESLMQAQSTMMSQMQVLQARIEKTEQATAANQQALEATTQQTQSNTGALDSFAKRISLSGYVETGFRAYSHAPRTEEFLDHGDHHGNTFDMRRVVLRPQVAFTDKARWFGEVEFEDTGLDEISVEESVFNYAFKPWLNVKSGLMVLPYTYTAVNHAGYQRLLVDRPLVDNFIIPSTYRDMGVGVTGVVPVFKQGALSYEVDVVNGLQDTIAPDDIVADALAHDFHPLSSSVDFEGLRASRPNEGISNNRFRDNNTNKQIFGRVGFSPFPGLQMGVSASSGRIDPDNHESLTIVAGDAQYRYKKFSLLGEYATDLFGHSRAFNSQGVPFSKFPKTMQGYYLQAAYDLTEKLTSVAAYNLVDLDTKRNGDSIQRFSLGLRYSPLRNVYLKTEYQLTTPRAGFRTAEHYSNALLTQLTFYMP